MALDEKIQAAEKMIRECVDEHKNPVLMCSFGKDSTCLLHMLIGMGYDLPILFHREPFNGRKYEFADRIIHDWNLTIYDYPPITTAVTERAGVTDLHGFPAVEIVNFYQVKNQLIYLPTGIRPPEQGKPFLCGLRDLYCRPLGTFAFPWDLAFVAHKSTDVDPILGPANLHVDIKRNPDSCDYAFPLRWFTDADVWEYHKRFEVPINTKRYAPENGCRERTDITFNNDYHHACCLCLLKSSPPMVACPKLGTEIPNISSIVRRADDVKPDYFGLDENPGDNAASRLP